MKPRIEKKVSKRLAVLLADKPRLIGRVWIDTEFERYVSLWRSKEQPAPTPGEVRRYYEAKARVNHMPSVGGGLDYWGEGQDYHTVFQAVTEHMFWSAPEVQARFDLDAQNMDAAFNDGQPVEPLPQQRAKMPRHLARPTGAHAIRYARSLT